MKKSTIKLVVLTSIVVGCSKEEITPRNYPRVNTIEATDITSGGATFKGEITFSSVPVFDHGFLWSESTLPLLDNSDKISLGSKSGIGAFEAKCDRSLQEGKKYFVRGYAISENHSVFGNVVEFISLGSKAPVLKDFYPALATWGDTITLVGENFSTVTSKTVVKFNEVQAVTVKASVDTLKVIAPPALAVDFSMISVSLTGNASTLSKKFQLNAPIIESVIPPNGVVGTKVTITGKFFGSANTKIYFNTIEATIVRKGLNFIEVMVPANVPGGQVELKVVTGSGTLFDIASFETQAPEIFEILPTLGSWGDVLTIKGKFFGPDPESNSVKFDDTDAQVLSASTTEITVEVPGAVMRSNPAINVSYLGLTGSINGFSYRPPEITSISPTRGSLSTEMIIYGKYFNPYYTTVFLDDQPVNYVGVYSSTEIRAQYPNPVDKHSAKLKVVWNDQEATSDQDFNLPLLRLEDYPCEYLSRSISMVYNNKAYVGLGFFQSYTNQLWSFDPVLAQWNQLNDFPGPARSDAISFVVGNRGYVGGGSGDAIDPLKDLWEYNFATDSWAQKSDLPITLNAEVAFSVGNTAYLIENNVESSMASLWKYNPASDTWLLKSIPGNTFFRNVHFILNDVIYILDFYGGVWKFIPSTEQWTFVGSCPTNFDIAFSSNGSGYASSDNALYRFDPTTNTWHDDLWTGDLGVDFAITVNDKGYMLGYSSYYKFCYEYDGDY